MSKPKTHPDGLKRITINLTTEQAAFVEAYILECARNGERITVTDVIRTALDKFRALEAAQPTTN